MSDEPRNVEHSCCIYCGTPTRGRRTCPAHRDLEAIDPALVAERPASNGYVKGAPPQGRSVARRTRRRP